LDSEDDESDQEVPVTKKHVVKKARMKRNLDAEIEVVEDDVEPCKEVLEAVSAEEVRYVGLIIYETLTCVKDDDLNGHHCGAKLVANPIKKELTLDLLTIMSDRVIVNFKVGENKFETEKGQWCNSCK
jgi:hypothetical protein